MVRIPDFAQVSLQPAPMQNYQTGTPQLPNIDVGRDAMQLGQAIQQLGAGASTYGAALLSQAQRDQNELNRTYAVEQFVNYRGAVDKQLWDPQAGYFTKGGREAFEGGRDSVFSSMKQLRDEHEKKLPTQAAKDLFRQRAMLFDEERGLQVDAHAGKERKVYQAAIDAQLLVAETADTPLQWRDADEQRIGRQPDPNNPNDRTVFETRLDALQQLVRDAGQRKGEPSEVIEANVQATTTAVYGQIVDAQQDPQKKLQLFDRFVEEGKIKSTETQKVRSQLAAKVEEFAGEQAAFAAWDGSGGNYDLALLQLEDQRKQGTLTIDRYNKALPQLNRLQGQKQTAHAAAGLRTLSEARDWMNDPANSKAGFGDMPEDLVTRLRDTDMLDHARKYWLSDRQFTTKRATVDQFAALAAAGRLNEMAPEQFEATFRPGMDDAMYAVAWNTWLQQNPAYAQDPARATGAGAGSRMARQQGGVPEHLEGTVLNTLRDSFPDVFKLNDSGKPTGDGVAAWVMFQRDFGIQYAEAMKDPQNQKDPDMAATKVLRKMVTEVDKRPGNTFGKPIWSLLPDERAQAMVEVNLGGEVKVIESGKVTPLERQRALASLQEQGVPYGAQSEADVVRAAAQRRATLAAQREQQRKSAGGTYVSWHTVKNVLGLDRDQVVAAALSDAEQSPVHPDDIAYYEDSYLSGRSLKFGKYASEPAETRETHIGISRAAFDRIRQHQNTRFPPDVPSDILLQPEAPPDMSYSDAVNLSKFARNGAMQPPRQLLDRAIAAMELQFPHLGYAAERAAETPNLARPSNLPMDVIDTYNDLRARAAKLPLIRFSPTTYRQQ